MGKKIAVKPDQVKKYMSLNDFIDQGYLKEVNRQLFHPRGLALEVTTDDKGGRATLSGMIDVRDDPEGYSFDETFLKTAEVRAKADFIYQELMKRALARKRLFRGATIQPIPLKKKKKRKA